MSLQGRTTHPFLCLPKAGLLILFCIFASSWIIKTAMAYFVNACLMSGRTTRLTFALSPNSLTESCHWAGVHWLSSRSDFSPAVFQSQHKPTSSLLPFQPVAAQSYSFPLEPVLFVRCCLFYLLSSQPDCKSLSAAMVPRTTQ